MAWGKKTEKTSDKYHSSKNSDDCKHPNQSAHIRTESNGRKNMVVDCNSCGMEYKR